MTVLDALAARRTELLDEQTTDLAVPMWTEPRLWLRARPLEYQTIRRIASRVEKVPAAQRAEAELNANASMIGAATVAVVIGDGEEQAVVTDLMDEQLLKALGLPVEGNTVASVVRALCLRDGDVIALAVAVQEHSGYGDDAARQALQGE